MSASRWPWWWRRRIAAAKDAAERVAVDYETLDAVIVTRGGRASAARRGSTITPATSASTPTWATSRPPRRRSPAPRISRSSTPGSIASPACRSMPAPRSASTIRRPNKYTLHAGCGGVVRQKAELADILGVEPTDVRVECGDVGGNFGTRNAFYPEFALVVWAAKRLGRPVKWTCERSEAFASDYQGRDQAIQAGACARRQGPFPGAARLGDLQHRRAYGHVRAAGEMRRAADLGLSHAGGAFPRPRGPEQHAADQSLPQRRPARGDLRHRAADRRRGASSSATTASICAAAI